MIRQKINDLKAIVEANTTNSVPVPVIGVGAIVFNKHMQVLLIQRNQAPAIGLWSIPGGKQEAGECLEQACSREVKEETGLEVVVEKIVAVVERQAEGFHYVIIDYLARLVDEENSIPTAQSDVADARWINLKQFTDYELVPGLEEIILRSYKDYHTGYLSGLYDVYGTGTDYILPVENYTTPQD